MDTSRRYSASCPISYRPNNDSEQQKKKVLGYIFSGYETCDSAELHDVCLQTDLKMADWNDQYFENIIELFTTENDIGDSRPVEEFADVIESGEEDFYSVTEEKIEERRLDAPHTISIQLKDSPHITLEDGKHTTKISLTSKYLEQNRLELTIGEGPGGNVTLKAGEAEIYPSDKAPPSGINISVTDEKKDAEADRSPDDGEKKKRNYLESEGRKIGLLSLVVDNMEQRNIEHYAEEKHYSNAPGGNIVQCISDYGYLKEYDKREVGIVGDKSNQEFGKIQKVNAAMKKERGDPEMFKIQEKEMFKRVKKKFFKNVLEGDPRLDYLKRELIAELVKKGYDKPEPEKFKSTEVQTEVHINPSANDDFSFSDDSDSLLRRYYALRDFSTLSSSLREPSQTQHNTDVNQKTADKSNTHDATMGQIDPEFSTRTERTMDGISELTERNGVGNLKEKEDATDDDVSDISTKPKKSHSVTSIEKRSKLIDTEELESDIITDMAQEPDRQLRSPSLLKALKSFDEELNPLQQELSRLLSDFKSIDIPEEVQASVAGNRLPNPSSNVVDSPTTSGQYRPIRDESIHHLYRTNLPPPVVREQRCNCAPGICLGFGRSSGIICQRIKRLPPSASSSEFFREFTRPAWISGSFRPLSIFSEPEDIYGDRSHPRSPSAMSVQNNDIYNKRDLT